MSWLEEELGQPADPRRLLRVRPEGREAWTAYEDALAEMMRQLQLATIACFEPIVKALPQDPAEQEPPASDCSPPDPSLGEARQLAEWIVDSAYPERENPELVILARALLSALDALGRQNEQIQERPLTQSPVTEAERERSAWYVRLGNCPTRTLCRDSGEPAVNGMCVEHKSDACLYLYVRYIEARDVLDAALSSSDSGHRQADQGGTPDAVPSSKGDKTECVCVEADAEHPGAGLERCDHPNCRRPR